MRRAFPFGFIVLLLASCSWIGSSESLVVPTRDATAPPTRSSADATTQTGAVGLDALTVATTIHADEVLRPISPRIYGLADCRSALRPGLCRWGGNPSSRYNWELGNAWNSAADWEFRNGNYGAASDTDREPSGVADQAISSARQRNIPFLVTVPALGWVARDDDNATQSTAVPPTGGPARGPASDGSLGVQGAIAGYDPSANRARTSIRSVARKRGEFRFPPDRNDGVVYQDEWVAHLVRRFGRADQGGVAYYAIDNEPDLWSYTHRDVHPAHPTFDSTLATFVEYATAVKDIDPSARIVGPVVSGWTGMFYSAADRGEDNFRTAADRRAHDDEPFLPWFLQQVRAHDQETGRRTLDMVAVHWYPQGGEYGAAPDETTDARRLRATRQLWDPNYRDESWIARTRDSLPSGAVQLIPRLRAWIDQYYPGTELGITEWNYGSDDTMNGALAIADVLGIFGREGVDLAAYWRAPSLDSPGARAFELYRNYDGQGGQFGDQALAVTSSARNGDQVSIYASRDSQTQDIIIIGLNKQSRQGARIGLRIDGTTQLADEAQWRLFGSTSPERIVPGPNLPVVQNRLTLNLPPMTMALVRISPKP